MENIDFSKHINNVDPRVQWRLNQIIKLLMEYGQMTKPDALDILLSSSIPAICDEDQ